MAWFSRYSLQSSQPEMITATGMPSKTPYGHHHFPTHSVQSYDMIVQQQTPQWQTTLYVAPYTTQNDLIPLFQNFGYVVETRFQADRGFAFVKMDSHENAAMVICQLSGYNINGELLKCSMSILYAYHLYTVTNSNFLYSGKDRYPTGQFDIYSHSRHPHSDYYPQYYEPISPQGPYGLAGRLKNFASYGPQSSTRPSPDGKMGTRVSVVLKIKVAMVA
jgi:nucleolysin TIA-1/TIAR